MRSNVRIISQPEAGIAELERLARGLRGNNSVKVGLPRSSNAYPDGTSVIMVGSVHEFGSPLNNIPQRSFLRSTIESGRQEYKSLFRKLTLKIIRNQITKSNALRLIGLQVQGDVQAKITDGIEPQLKSRDGTPLIDTGHLRQSITFQVDE